MSDQLRLSDAERELAAADLGEHYAQGRLTADEHAERLDQIWAAKTRGEIAPIFRDLPSAYAVRAPRVSAPSPVRAPRGRRGWSGLPWPVLVLLGVLLFVAVVSHLPLLLIGFLVWFFVFRGCGPRRHGWR